MALRTLHGRLARFIAAFAFATLATPVMAYPQVAIGFYPADMKPGDTVTLSISLSDTVYALSNANIALFDFSPFTYTGGAISSNCGGSATASGSTMSLTGAVWGYTYPPCAVSIPVTYSGPVGTPTVTFPAGAFVNSTAGSNPVGASATICVHAPTVVTSPADSGPGTLRDVITTAADSSTEASSTRCRSGTRCAGQSTGSLC